eukprot:13460573-Heterocapsa_arctica.AAC.1
MHGVPYQRALLRIRNAILLRSSPGSPAAAGSPTEASSCLSLGAHDGREGEIVAQLLRQVGGGRVREALDHPLHVHVDWP